ncbi:MAG: pyridoxamine 5'-phosphate oxidase family protein [Pleomorphochaeta sp.]
MRRNDRAVKDINEIKQILDNNDVCRIAFKDDNGIYIVPLTYGYSLSEDEKLTFYFHGAKVGRKVKAFEENMEVGFEIDEKNELKATLDTKACTYTYLYKSIIGNGIASIIDGYDEKLSALRILMKHVTKKDDLYFNEASVRNVLVMKIEVSSYSAKRH